ncbi:hypothetical protein M427DRAFT_96362 [Gonapodya prolifera JEL478]|uniref:N-acetyltransferase domain-containing protein n=1 Tax=Gonapodya prolifera (strain JEL478) TaxID=1344416 RepID=A0A139AN83_GONPJ|nr:hypothetical protein M427DRAFT_96362 [Gonapodya prolifera JEL478]|eukprot:KXS18168.1 hypothetical protein M427DRAFT_96362 [Gonapodya prolifera JEL478]
MRINEKIALRTSKCVLVPYEKHHVPIYHEWMKSPEIQYLTASEPLTLDEEYQMQQSWRTDTDKLTFIVLDPSLEDNRTPEDGNRGGSCQCHSPVIAAYAGMVGDVNLFFTDFESAVTAELEVMIAVAGARGKGIGEAACRGIMAFATSINRKVHGKDETVPSEGEHFPVTVFRAKIKTGNSVSLNLFQNKLGFVEVSRSQVFDEITLELPVNETMPRYSVEVEHL